MLPWQAKALWPLVLRKLDRAGLMPLDGHGAAGLAAVVELPLEVVEPGLSALIDSEYVRLHSETLVSPNFIKAQEAPQSDGQRKREQRARAADAAAAAAIGIDVMSQNVTGDAVDGHAASRSVTNGHSVPSLTVPSRTQAVKDGGGAEGSEAVPLFPELVPLTRNAALARIATASKGAFVARGLG